MPRFLKLRGKMRERNITQADIAVALGCSTVSVSQRFCAKSPWQLDEIWTLLRILHIPAEDMYLYFPLEGRGD